MRVITDSEAYKYCKNPLHYFDTNDSKYTNQNSERGEKA